MICFRKEEKSILRNSYSGFISCGQIHILINPKSKICNVLYLQELKPPLPQRLRCSLPLLPRSPPFATRTYPAAKKCETGPNLVGFFHISCSFFGIPFDLAAKFHETLIDSPELEVVSIVQRANLG